MRKSKEERDIYDALEYAPHVAVSRDPYRLTGVGGSRAVFKLGYLYVYLFQTNDTLERWVDRVNYFAKAYGCSPVEIMS